MTELKPLIEYVPEPKKAFLSQPLTLGMFVPCDEEGGVMDAPDLRLLSKEEKKKVNGRYKAAFDRVIFDGFEVTKSDIFTWITNGDISLEFHNNSVCSSVNVPIRRVPKTISDLCGLGIKCKMPC